MGILWVLILLCATSPSCPLYAVSCRCSPHLSRAGLLVTVQHAALFCPCSAISLSQGHSGGFQLLLYTALCEPHHPFPLCLGSFQKWGDQLWCSWSQSDIRRGTWALCVLSGHVGKCMALLVKNNAELLGAQRRNKVIGASWAPR